METHFFDFFDSLFNTLQECKQNGHLPPEFLDELAATVRQETLKPVVIEWLGPLSEFNWDVDSGTFTQPWNLETVNLALQRMTKWKTDQQFVKLEQEVKQSMKLKQDVEQSMKLDQEDKQSMKLDQEDKQSMKLEQEEKQSMKLEQEEKQSMKLEQEVKQREPAFHQKQENNILPKWLELVGECKTRVSLAEFVKVRKMLTLPSEQALVDQFGIELSNLPLNPSDLKGWISKVLPYMIQKIKMWGCFELEPRALKSLIHEVEIKQEAGARSGPKMLKRNAQLKLSTKADTCNTVPFSRIDLITCIINCVDVLVAQDLLKNMAMFPIALPLIIPSIFNEDMINVIPLLKYLPIRWKVREEIVENYLFSSSFRIVLAIRLGSSANVGKSCILNHVLRREYVFSCRQEPGASFGIPFALGGFVEFVPLTEESCRSDLWKNGIQQQYVAGSNHVILLANMHGDPLDHPEVFNTVMHLASGVVVFVMENVEADRMEKTWNELTTRFGDDVQYLEVDSRENSEETAINVVDLNNDVTLRKVRKAIVGALSSGGSTNYDDMNLEHFSSLKSAGHDHNPNSKKIADLVRKHSCKTVKKDILSNPKSMETYTSQLIQGLRSIICLQLNDRMMAMTDLERRVTELSNEQSFAARCRLVKLEDELKKEKGKLIKCSTDRVDDIEKNICELLNDINDTNLGVEHFYRMLGGFYINALRVNPLHTIDLALGYAELLMSGFAIELLDGDSPKPTIQGPWLTAICDKVCFEYSDLRIYVVTVIGLQSSGKSTLLNALFGCKFAVSVGRCTRGLFMRLLILDENLKQELDVDAILLIDMEGLGAPEKVNDPDSDKKDRLMATFAMGISNLTLINIYGEAANSMTDILQVAIVAMARLEEAKMDPDLYVVQHLSEKNQQKLATAHKEFIKAIETVVKLTEEKGTHIGIINSSCLNNLVLRIQKGNVLKAFGPYKDGERVNSPPSQGYHESVVDLYKSILEACKECKRKLKLSVWSSLLEGYLDAVLKEDMAVRFKNLTDMAEHLAREREIAKTKETIEKAFRQHAEELEKVIIERVRCQDSQQQMFATEQDQVDDLLAKIISSVLECVPQTCQTDKNAQCVHCCKAVSQMNLVLSDKQHRHESSKTLQAFKYATKESYEVKMRNMIGAQRLQHGCSKEFHMLLNNSLSKHKHEAGAGEQLTESEKEHISDVIWTELKLTVANQYPYITSIQNRLDRDIANVYLDQPNVLSRYTSGMVSDLKKIPAVSRLESFKHVLNPCLDIKDYLELERILCDAPERYVKMNKIHDYSPQVIVGVKYYIIDIIQDFERDTRQHLLPKFQTEVCVIALKKFAEYFAHMQTNWESQRHPQKLLEMKEGFYRSLINTRLTLGFSAAAEGRIIADLLLQDVNIKASKFAHDRRVEKVSNEQWMLNSENVRLRFFEMLAEKVEADDKEEALNYFKNPKKSIRQWFHDTVDVLYPDVTPDYDVTFTAELKTSIQVIRNTNDMNEIIRYLNTMSSDCYEPSEGSRDNLEILKANVESGVEMKKNLVKKTKEKLSTDSRIIARLGCVEYCPYCGALCWGSVGHEQDSGSTKRHHASHQPSGLNGLNYYNTRELCTIACQEWNDDIKWHVGDKRVPWKELKAERDEWLFDAHHQNTFNQLMYWFFLKLNVDLATKYQVNLPRKEEMQAEVFTSLSSEQVDRIMATIKQKLI